MKFIIKVNNKVVYAVDSHHKDTKNGYANAQELINKFLNDTNTEHYKMVLEH